MKKKGFAKHCGEVMWQFEPMEWADPHYPLSTLPCEHAVYFKPILRELEKMEKCIHGRTIEDRFHDLLGDFQVISFAMGVYCGQNFDLNPEIQKHLDVVERAIREKKALPYFARQRKTQKKAGAMAQK